MSTNGLVVKETEKEVHNCWLSSAGEHMNEDKMSYTNEGLSI